MTSIERLSLMTFLSAPDSPAAAIAFAQSYIMANPVMGFAIVTLVCGIFAAWAVKVLF